VPRWRRRPQILSRAPDLWRDPLGKRAQTALVLPPLPTFQACHTVPVAG